MSPQAAAPFDRRPAPEIITFDCYGTLVQWDEVLLCEIGITLAAQGVDAAGVSAILDSVSAQGRRLTGGGASPSLQGHPAHRFCRSVR